MEYDGWLRIGTKVETKNFDAQIDYIENQMLEIENKLKQADFGFEVGDVSKLEAQYEKLANQLVVLKQKQEDLNKTDLRQLEKSIDKIGSSTEKNIKKVGKWALAVFSVRSAYMFVRQAVNKLSQYNEKLAADLEYISFALASMLQPLIEKLIQLAYKLLNYVNYIAQAWFGINLFANASVEAFNKMNKSASKLRKTLAGFDEMNVLNDNGSVGILGGMPDLSSIQGNTPEWLQWIAENKTSVISGLTGIASALTLVKLGMGGIKAIGFGVTIAGITMAIQELLDYLKSPDWDNFGGTMEGLGITALGVGLIFGQWPIVLAGALIAMTGYLIKHKEEVEKKWTELKDWLFKKIIEPIESRFGVLGRMITAPIKSAIETIEFYFSNALENARDIFDGIIKIFKGDFKNGFIQAGKGILNAMINLINLFINSINTIISPIRRLIVEAGKIIGTNWTMSDIKIPTIPKLAVGGIVNMPGRGVPVGGAIAGEAGKEGVLPLTDSQTMEELGSAIGRYITINATLINQMNGRTISRELKKVQNESAFATNR